MTFRSVSTSSRTRRGSRGTSTFSTRGSSGRSAGRAWSAMRYAAPILVSTTTVPGPASRK